MSRFNQSRSRRVAAHLLTLARFLSFSFSCVFNFIRGLITVDKPLLTVDKASGLVIVHPEGKEAKTTFERQFYDEARNESVVECKPFTGRSEFSLRYLLSLDSWREKSSFETNERNQTRRIEADLALLPPSFLSRFTSLSLSPSNPSPPPISRSPHPQRSHLLPHLRLGRLPNPRKRRS